VLRGARPTGSAAATLTRELRDWVSEQLGPIAKPDDIRFADNLPKTRSGKIMRRLLRAVANGEEVTQDVSTLENPAILEQLRGTDQGAKAAAKPAAAPSKKAAKPKTAGKRAARKAVSKKAVSKKTAPRKTAPSKAAPRKRATARPSAAGKKARAPRRAAPRRKR